jgi:YidC/Oxa1 family membrane protein insertase
LDRLTNAPVESTPSDTADFVDPLDSTPEYVGYLKEVCGIDFGWGPSSLMQWTIEHLHIDGGLGWAFSIVGLAVLFRAVLVYPSFLAMREGAKVKAVKPILEPIQARIKECTRNQDSRGRAEVVRDLKALNSEYRLNSFAIVYPILLQIPLSFGGFRLLRNMTDVPVPALLDEKWLWLHDLTLSDPYTILPIANASLIYFSIKVCIIDQNFPSLLRP